MKKERIVVSHKSSIEDFHPNTIMESKNYNSLKIYFHLSKHIKIIHLKKKIEASSSRHHQLKDRKVKLIKSKREK